MLRHKYHAVKTDYDNIKFDSKKEAEYYKLLKLRVRAGEVIVFLRQVPFHLPGNIVYRVDFMEFHKDGTVHFIDVKGYETKDFKRNKKLVETIYAPIQIEVIR